MAMDTWTATDTQRAQHSWAEYQRQHDVSSQQGQTAGIDPASGRLWFGVSAQEIMAQMEAAGVVTPLSFVRVGVDSSLRKGRQRCSQGR